ncbi:MAG TPA: Ig-like domain-containing protein [Candidatus Limnocylindrales bacterium]|nr:Ig-like domain-containing protein [Candidatus Limnocylindrales bacterium]
MAREPRTRRRSTAAATAAALLLAFVPALAGTALAAPPPSASDDAYSTDEDTELDVSVPGVFANDGTAGDGNRFCIASYDDAQIHGSLAVLTDGSFTYTPSANYHGDGADNSFTYTMYEIADDHPCDGPNGSTATVEITVNAVNDAPTAKADKFQALKNETLVISAPGVLSNDGDIDGDSLTAVKVNNPTHGVVVLAADGSFSYTPATNFTGTDTFSYQASDGEDMSPTRVVTITVTSVPPINTPTPPPPTPAPTPVPTPTPEPTLTPVVTEPPVEETLEPGASATAFVPPTPQLSGAPTQGAGASPGAPSLAPGQTAQPGEASSSGGFGTPLTILLGITLLALIAGVAAAMYGPRWLESRRNRQA